MASASTSHLPLLGHRHGEPVALWRGRPVSRERFLAHVERLTGELPERRFAVNLCQDRYPFLVALSAAMIRGQTTLLPHARVPRLIAEVCDGYPGAYALTERAVEGLELVEHLVRIPEDVDLATRTGVPRVPADLLAAVLFTSGSSGRPRPSAKRWGDLVAGARLVARRFALARRPGGSIVATVPPRHMFGLEVSVALPLVCGITVHAATPLFPESVRRTLEAAPEPRRLFTTPTHLRACVEVDLRWPALDLVVSSSAPLAAGLAARSEAALAAPVHEIYGCTEAGAIATRRTVEGPRWRLCDGLALTVQDETALVSGLHLPEPVPLGDRVEIHRGGEFELDGRRSDLVKVAGNRALLSDLNLKLNEVDGVEDGVFVMPEGAGDGASQRPVALVVAPNLEKRDIVAALSTSLHPAFLPRSLYKVARLPRDDVGKLPREDLLALVASLSGPGDPG